jgi:hypothetical protein
MLGPHSKRSNVHRGKQNSSSHNQQVVRNPNLITYDPAKKAKGQNLKILQINLAKRHSAIVELKRRLAHDIIDIVIAQEPSTCTGSALKGVYGGNVYHTQRNIQNIVLRSAIWVNASLAKK